VETIWQQVDCCAAGAISGLPGARVEPLPVFRDARGSLHELFRNDETPEGFLPVMACSSWSEAGVTRGPHQHAAQDDYFTFAGPSDFTVCLWDNRAGAAREGRGWFLLTGEQAPVRLFVPRGVVHAYRNSGLVRGLVVTASNALFRGRNRTQPVDETRHEMDPNSPFRMPPP
jgi:dTDP-4-dehydrorhamnose 3,5-epimerase